MLGSERAYPEFADANAYPDARVEALLAESQVHWSRDAHGVYLVLAHLLSRDPDGYAGEVTGTQVGEQRDAMRPQAESGQDAFYTSTEYGRRFLQYMRASAPLAVIVG